MKQIAADIKNGQYKKLYLLYGNEAYLKKLYLSKLLNGLGAVEGDMNFSRFTGNNVRDEDIIGTAETLPFFADRRVILVDGANVFKEKHELLEEYLSKLPDYLTVIFSETEADKRSRLYKTIVKYGYAAEFASMDTKDLAQYTAGRLAAAGKKIRRDTCEEFLAGTGTDLYYINNELDKLISYMGGREVVTIEDIEAVCSPVVENRIFDLVSAVTSGDKRTALLKYNDLLTLKEPPMRILYLLARQFDQMLHIKEMAEEGSGPQLIAEKLKMNPYVVKKMMPGVKRYSKEELRLAVEDMVKAEEDVKTGFLAERLSVELMIIKYSGKK